MWPAKQKDLHAGVVFATHTLMLKLGSVTESLSIRIDLLLSGVIMMYL